MKRNKTYLFFFAVSVIMQRSLFKAAKIETPFPFLFGLPESLFSNSQFFMFELYLIIPVIFFLLYFNSGMSSLNGYKTLLVIRGTSKYKIYFKEFMLWILKVISAFIFQSVFYWNTINEYVPETVFKAALIYCLGLLLLIQIQNFLEYYTEAGPAYIITVLLFSISYSVVCLSDKMLIKQIFITGFMFGENNGAVNNNALYTQLLTEYFLFNIIAAFVSVKKFARKDIY